MAELTPEELEQAIEDNDTGVIEDGFGETPDELIEPEDFAEVIEDED